jgi:hypothetical protein
MGDVALRPRRVAAHVSPATSSAITWVSRHDPGVLAMFSSLVLGSGSFPGRRAHELALVATGWIALAVALVAGWAAGLLVLVGGWSLAAVSGRRGPRPVEAPDEIDEIDLRLERVLERLEHERPEA